MTDILTAAANGLGHITLNRPAALHALNTGMCAAMIDALVAWRDDRSAPALDQIVAARWQTAAPEAIATAAAAIWEDRT